MRTTLTIDDDVTVQLERLRRTRFDEAGLPVLEIDVIR